MVVRQVVVPNPAAGADWSFTVPAQWLPYLYGVTAVLTTALPLTTIPDESGNGRDATVQKTADYQIGAQGPFAGGADNVAVFGPNVQVPPNVPYCKSASLVAFDTATYSADEWVFIPADYPAIIDGMNAYAFPGGSGAKFSFNTRANQANPYDVSISWAGSVQFTFPGFASTGAWHHVGWSFDGVNAKFYRDGALINTTAAAPPAVSSGCAVCAGGSNDFGDLRGRAAACAFYPAALGAGLFAAHAAASSSWAAYKTAVLADGPSALYRIGQTATGASRIVTLKVTDGTNVVAQFPANFAAATADTFTWSWQVLGPGAGASTDGRINSVPIPELRVDAGYVISAKTLDLAVTDQWSSIVVWFDDGTGPAGGGGGTGGAFAGGLLVPDYSHSGG